MKIVFRCRTGVPSRVSSSAPARARAAARSENAWRGRGSAIRNSGISRHARAAPQRPKRGNPRTLPLSRQLADAGRSIYAPRGGMQVGEREAVDREAELARIASFLDGAQTERALWLEGDAGIGKSVLLRAAGELARERGDRVLSCRAAAAETNFSFASLADLIEPVADEVLPALPGPQRVAAEAALGLAAAEGGTDERRVGLALPSTLRRLALESPVLLA